ncbi:MAG TPA: T6SS effector amidase Tae4 family protein [Kofleriaceae bacterium]|nr:T6SS effector amidase Tae4 family protein [Kofleriaceae bacterium]
MAQHAQKEPDLAEVDTVKAEVAEREDAARRKKGDAAADVQLAYGDTAERGVAGASSSLPHLERIQRSFGDFDVSNVKARQGGEAAAASQAMGADAYATGDKVGFKDAPDLHTAAHEAAHVVQQRAGVQFKNGVGREGDAYERHADAVADKVVAGEPADYLLSQMAGSGARAQASTGAGSAGSAGVQLKATKEELPKGAEGFEQMWDAHPHNYQEDDSQNTSSDEVRDEQGLPDYLENTCAIRLSTMLNNTGHEITPAKTKAAGIARAPIYSKKTKHYYIVSAKEMWTYLQKNFRAADVEFPKGGKRFKDSEEFQAAFDSEIKPLLDGKQGIVAFDKIFSYGGTGHVDLFNGTSLSDASDWYPSQHIMLWYISVA